MMIELIFITILFILFCLTTTLTNIRWFKKLTEQNRIWAELIQKNSRDWFKMTKDIRRDDIDEIKGLIESLLGEEDEENASEM